MMIVSVLGKEELPDDLNLSREVLTDDIIENFSVEESLRALELAKHEVDSKIGEFALAHANS